MSRINSLKSTIQSLTSATARKQKRRFAAGPPCHLSYILRSNSGVVPIAAEDYRIVISSTRTVNGTTDDEGRLTVHAVPAGDYLISFPNRGLVSWISAIPTDMEDVPLRIAGFMYLGKDRPSPDSPSWTSEMDSSTDTSSMPDDEDDHA